MSQLSKMLEAHGSSNWLSAIALWTVIGSWAACGVWGWSQNAAGLMAGVTIALTVGCQVFASRSLKNAAATDEWAKKAACVALGVACLAFSAYSGRQGLATSEGQRWASYEARARAQEAVAAIDRKIDTVPSLPLSDEARRPIGPLRLAELGAERQNEVARLMALRSKAQSELDALPEAPRPAAKMGADQLTALIAALELLGFYAIARGKPAAAIGEEKAVNAVDINHARELAKRRWSQA